MQFRNLLFAVVAGLAALTANSQTASGCDHCGGGGACQKVCRLVCENKKVEVTCWGCKCEDFCIPGPSKRGCKHCDTVCEFCDDCDPNAVHAQPKKFVWYDWMPGCATIHTRKKLVKQTVTKTVPSYKWVVEDLCPQCVASAESAPVPAGTDIPRPPISFGSMKTILPVGFLQK
jgi:hypothetical protein